MEGCDEVDQAHGRRDTGRHVDDGRVVRQARPQRGAGRRGQCVAQPVATMHAQAIVIGTDLYLKTDEPPPGVSRKKWMHVDISKLPEPASTGLGDLSDPSGLGSYAKAVATVHRTGPGQYEGTLDFSKLVDLSIVGSIGPIGGDAIKAVPFTAATDEQDRLTSMAINMPSMGA